MSRFKLNNLSEQQKQWAAILISCVLVLAVALYQFVYSILPYAADEIADSLPDQIYQALDQAALSSLEQKDLSASQLDKAKQRQLEQLFIQLLPPHEQAKAQALLVNKQSSGQKAEQENQDQIGPPPNTTHGEVKGKQYRLLFRNWQDKANALALANGTIIITDKMVSLLDKPEQLEAVLLHEIAHVHYNHVSENLIKLSIVSVTISFVLGDISALGDVLLSGASMGIGAKFSRDAEIEADRYAASKLKQKYGNNQAMAAVLTKLKSQSDEHNASWLSSHPGLDERLKLLSSPIKP